MAAATFDSHTGLRVTPWSRLRNLKPAALPAIAERIDGTTPTVVVHNAATTGPLGPLVPATTSLTPATMAVSPTNVPAEFISDDCFKFFNPVSTEGLTQYNAQWKLALMRASQFLAEEKLGLR